VNVAFRFLAILALLFVCINSRGSAAVDAGMVAPRTWQQLVQLLEERVPVLMKEKRVPGLSVALVRNSNTVWHHSFGVRNAETGEPVGEETIFEAASLGKPVFAYAVLKLVERGKLDLDTPLVAYLTGAKVNSSPIFDYDAVQTDPLLKKVTARHVLSHTPGLPNWNKPLKVYFTPGEKFSYSGQGFVFLQLVAERLSGQPLDQFMREFVFNPLGMNQSSFVCDEECRRLRARGHTSTGQAFAREMPGANAAASLHTTAQDYAKFLMAMMGGKGLKKESLRLMLTPQVRVDEGCVTCIDRGTGKLSQSLSWGLGWGLQHTKEDRAFWHWGSNAGIFNAYTQVSQKQGLGLIVLTNSGNGLSLIPEMVFEVFGRDQPALEWIKNR
jgi:CubicO group peptidase (beta-lactamase class C family)